MGFGEEVNKKVGSQIPVVLSARYFGGGIGIKSEEEDEAVISKAHIKSEQGR